MVLLKIRRQYAFLRLRSIDMAWHPFSIASGPRSLYLEFYIEVFDDKNLEASA